MASRRPFAYPRYQAWGDNETFLNGGTIEFFDAGTSNNRNIYQDAALTTTAPNPVTLNSRGEPQSAGGTAIDIYLDNQAYKIVLKDSSGTTKHTIDNYIETQDVLEPKDPADATDQSTDVFEGTLNSDPASGETFQVDFQTANTTTTPTFENTSGSLGAKTIKTRDGSALWSGALNGVHELKYNGTDYLVSDPYFGQNLSTSGTVTFRGNDPEHATDGGTDAFASATNTTVPSDGVKITRDFQSANTTTTPTLDGKTMTTRDGSALWAGAVSGPHELQYASGTDTYLVLEPNPSVQRDPTRAASATKKGDVELATSAETNTGTDTGRAITPAGGEATYLKRATTSSDPALALDTWRTPNANRPTVVVVTIIARTDGSTSGTVDLEIDESGGTTPDEVHRCTADGALAAHADISTFTHVIPAGGAYRLNNVTDPTVTGNSIDAHREFTL